MRTETERTSVAVMHVDVDDGHPSNVLSGLQRVKGLWILEQLYIFYRDGASASVCIRRRRGVASGNEGRRTNPNHDVVDDAESARRAVFKQTVDPGVVTWGADNAKCSTALPLHDGVDLRRVVVVVRTRHATRKINTIRSFARV